MPRRPRISTGGLAYHVLNRRIGRLPLFESPKDYTLFETILNEAVEHRQVRIAAYCLMPNHWHLLLWPREDGELSEVMRWITVTHTQRWHAYHQTAGTGPVYQGRFKSFPIQTDDHFITVARYVERNPLRAPTGPTGRELALVEFMEGETFRRKTAFLAEHLASAASTKLDQTSE